MSEILITPDGNIHQIDSGQTLPLIPGGITLRDWFAGQALAGFVNNSTFAAAAALSYKFADAMLERRKEERE